MLLNFLEKFFDACESLGSKLAFELLGGCALILNVPVSICRGIWATQWPEQSWWQHALQFVQIFLGGLGYCLLAGALILFSFEFMYRIWEFLDSSITRWRNRRKNLVENTATREKNTPEESINP